MKVAVIMGSRSDMTKMKGAADCLREFDILYSAHILSAHRVPEELEATLKRLESEGTEVIIAGAGLSAHLPGVVASKTVLPVIGVPLNASLGGQDSLLSIVQMPKGIPVATVGIDNSYNAGMLATSILAVKYPELRKRLDLWRLEMKKRFVLDNGEVDL
jgi:5-(carboxyamino)imidazole ribonucleotide mutase